MVPKPTFEHLKTHQKFQLGHFLFFFDFVILKFWNFGIFPKILTFKKKSISPPPFFIIMVQKLLIPTPKVGAQLRVFRNALLWLPHVGVCLHSLTIIRSFNLSFYLIPTLKFPFITRIHSCLFWELVMHLGYGHD